MNRPSINEYYIDIAKAVASRSACLKKHYGAVIVNHSRIISTGYNNPPSGEPHCKVCTKVHTDKDISEYLSCKSCHAEMNAIISASRADMLGADLYLAGFDITKDKKDIAAEPCEICLRLIKNAGINTVINNTGIIYSRQSDGILRRVNDIKQPTDTLKVKWLQIPISEDY